MTRLLLAGLVVVGVAFGVGVNADTPEDVFKQNEKLRHKSVYLQIAGRLADEWPVERLQEEKKRLTSELVQRESLVRADQQTPQIQEAATVAEEEDNGSVSKVDLEILPGDVFVLTGREEDVRRAREAIERQGSAHVGRFQIAELEKGYGPMFVVLDTTTGAVWSADNDAKPYKLMNSVPKNQE